MDQSIKLARNKETTSGVISAALVVLVLLGAAYAFWGAAHVADLLRRTERIEEVRLQLESAQAGFADGEAAVRGFLLTGREDRLSALEPDWDRVRQSLEALRDLTRDDAVQQERLKRLGPLFEERVARVNELVEVRRSSGLVNAASLVGTPEDDRLLEEIRTIVRQMQKSEEAMLANRAEASREMGQTMRIGVVLGSATIIGLVLWAAWTTRRELVARKGMAELQQAARRYAESIVDTVRDPLLVLDADLRVERANRAFYEVFRMSAAEIEQRPLAELGQGQWNRPELLHLLREALSLDRKFEDVEWEYTLPEDGKRVMLLSGSKLYRPGNHSEAVLLAIEDFTERKGADEALKASEERLRMIVDSIGDYGILMLDPEGRVLSWSRGAEQIKGYRAEEIIGRHFSRFYTPEDVNAGKPEQVLAEAREKGRVEDEGWRVKRDGTRFYANVIVSAIRDADDQLKGYTKVTRDITEQHRLAQLHLQFRTLFNSLPGLYLVLTPDLNIAAASDAYLEATMTRRDDIVDRHVFEVFPDNPEDPASTAVTNLRASLQRVSKTGQQDAMSIQRYDIRRPDGTFKERYWSPVNSPLLGADGKMEYIIHRVEDVTDFIKQKDRSAGESGETLSSSERMEAEIYRSAQRVEAVNRQLRAVNAELEAFSYSVSHDLRAPLRHIDGFADLLKNHASASLDDKSKRYIKTISDSAKRMGALIDDLLVFSRIGRSEMRRAKVDLNVLADEVIQELRMETQGRNVVWKRQGLPLVEGDSALLRQVLVNLFSNAVKYTRPRDPAIIEVGFVVSAIEYTIHVKDNGVGFDMAYVGKLFGVFQRLHRADEFEGTGIGLANVHRIILRHGGRTWAEGTPGEGATFYFTLPAGMPSSLSTAPTPPPIA